MLLFLENKQKIFRSNTPLHIFLIQNGFYINFQMISVVVNNLPHNTNNNFIVDWYNWNCNNRNHLTDRENI